MLINEDFIRVAEDQARLSPCLRRKYGAVISDGKRTINAFNTRVGRCCGSHDCIRDRSSLSHGQNAERGAEIHAETAALLMWKGSKEPDVHFYLAGFDKGGNPLLGKEVWPCHLCAMAMKFSGFNFVIIRGDDGSIGPVSIAQIIDEQEAAWDQLVYVL